MKQLRTVIIGLGNIAHGYEDIPSVTKIIKYPTHLSAIKKDKRFKLVAGSDPKSQSRKIFGSKVKSIKIYSDHKEMIKKENPDLVIVASPTGTHVKICKDAINLGVKNILCEKPIDYSLSQSKSLIDLAKKKKVKIAFNYFRVYDRNYKNFIKKIKLSEFGEIKSIKVKYSKGVFNTATHLINLLEKMFGPVKKVEKIKQLSKGQDPDVSFDAHFKNVVANFQSFTNTKPFFEINLFFGSKKIKILKDKSKQIKLNIDTSIIDVYDNLYKFINNKEQIDCSGTEALQTLKVAVTAIKADKLTSI